MADRPLDRLLPQTLALVFGLAALSAGVAAVAADFMIGRPSSRSALGIVFMFPLALLAAIVGFAIGHFIGLALQKRGFTPSVPMKPYRLLMAVALAAAIGGGAAAGARPVVEAERLHAPRVMAGEGLFGKEPGRPDSCAMKAAPVVCDLQTRQTSSTLPWNGREVTLGCTREGRITVSDAMSGVVASADLTAFEYVRQVQAAAVRRQDGREALAVLARLRATGRRDMFLMFDADGRVLYQELLGRTAPDAGAALSVCGTDDRDLVTVDLGAPFTYRDR